MKERFQLQFKVEVGRTGRFVWLCVVDDGEITDFETELEAWSFAKELGPEYGTRVPGETLRVAEMVRATGVSDACRESRGSRSKPARLCEEDCFVCSAVLAERMTLSLIHTHLKLPEYAEWIAKNVPDPRYACQTATREMSKTFPELTPARGFVTFFGMDSRSATDHPFDVIGIMHWWCKTADGQIVDPTRSQFGNVQVDYEEYNEQKHGPMPTGKCMNCGAMVYAPRSATCSDRCEGDLIRDLS